MPFSAFVTCPLIRGTFTREILRPLRNCPDIAGVRWRGTIATIINLICSNQLTTILNNRTFQHENERFSVVFIFSVSMNQLLQSTLRKPNTQSKARWPTTTATHIIYHIHFTIMLYDSTFEISIFIDKTISIGVNHLTVYVHNLYLHYLFGYMIFFTGLDSYNL